MCVYKCSVKLLLISLFLYLSFSSSPRFKIPESAQIDTVLGNLTVFEYLENKVKKNKAFHVPLSLVSH